MHCKHTIPNKMNPYKRNRRQSKFLNGQRRKTHKTQARTQIKFNAPITLTINMSNGSHNQNSQLLGFGNGAGHGNHWENTSGQSRSQHPAGSHQYTTGHQHPLGSQQYASGHQLQQQGPQPYVRIKIGSKTFEGTLTEVADDNLSSNQGQQFGYNASPTVQGHTQRQMLPEGKNLNSMVSMVAARSCRNTINQTSPQKRCRIMNDCGCPKCSPQYYGSAATQGGHFQHHEFQDE